MSHDSKKKTYWKGLQDLQALQTGAVQHEGEFKASPSPDNTDGTDGHSRREFLKIMGASLAMVGTSACTRRPVEHIVPYVKKPEDVTPGIANWYASTCGECDAGCGILVKSREGRPVKFEGNEHHPVNQGGLCARGQASVLSLYDPDRLRTPVEPGRKGGSVALGWEALDAKVVGKTEHSLKRWQGPRAHRRDDQPVDQQADLRISGRLFQRKTRGV